MKNYTLKHLDNIDTTGDDFSDKKTHYYCHGIWYKRMHTLDSELVGRSFIGCRSNYLYKVTDDKLSKHDNRRYLTLEYTTPKNTHTVQLEKGYFISCLDMHGYTEAITN